MKTAMEDTLLCAWSPIAVFMIICCQFLAMFIDVTDYDDCTISPGGMGLQNSNSIFSAPGSKLFLAKLIYFLYSWVYNMGN